MSSLNKILGYIEQDGFEHVRNQFLQLLGKAKGDKEEIAKETAKRIEKWLIMLAKREIDKEEFEVLIKTQERVVKYYLNTLEVEAKARLEGITIVLIEITRDKIYPRMIYELGMKKPEIFSERSDFEYDIFICHANEDKKSFVRGLAEKLSDKGISVWYDEFTLRLGDSLRRSINYGLKKSRYGLVVLSPHFFKKEWPQKELDGLVAREDGREKVILPIWHSVTKKDVHSFSPMLADRLAVSTDKGIEYVVQQILEVVHGSPSPTEWGMYSSEPSDEGRMI